MNKIPVKETISYAYSFTFGNLGAVVGLSWASLSLAALAVYLGFRIYAQSTVEFLQTHDPAAMLEGMAALFGALVLSFLFDAVAYVALTEKALGRRTGGAVIHLDFGRGELVMWWAIVKLMLAYMAILIVLVLAVALVAVVASLVFAGAGQEMYTMPAAQAIFAGIVGAGLFYFLVKMFFFLVPVVVVEGNRGAIRRSDALSKGNFWRATAVLLAIFVPTFGLFFLVQYAILGPEPTLPPGLDET